MHYTYIEKNILCVKHVYTYNAVLFMYKHFNDMLFSMFGAALCKVSDIHDNYMRKQSPQHHYVIASEQIEDNILIYCHFLEPHTEWDRSQLFNRPDQIAFCSKSDLV